MRGYLRRRGRESWSLVLDLPRGPDGRRRQKRYTLKGTRRIAEAAAARILTSVNNATPANCRKPVSECLADWLATRKQRVAASTYRRYESIVYGYLAPNLGQTNVSELTPAQIECAMEVWRRRPIPRRKKTVSERTVRHAFDTLKSALKYSMRCELISKNPCDAVDRPRAASTSPNGLSISELIVLVSGLEESPLQVPALIAAAGGFRRGELLGLIWNDIDMHAGVVQVQRSLSIARDKTLELKPPKTKKSRRYVVLPKFAMVALERYRELQAERYEGLCIPAPSGSTPVFDFEGRLWNPDKFSAKFYYEVHTRGLPATNFHGLRHTHASLSMQSGTPLKVTSDNLGHSSITITADLYTHVIDGDRLKAAERLQDLWDSAKKTCLTVL